MFQFSYNVPNLRLEPLTLDIKICTKSHKIAQVDIIDILWLCLNFLECFKDIGTMPPKLMTLHISSPNHSTVTIFIDCVYRC